MLCDLPPVFPQAVMANVAIAKPRVVNVVCNLIFIMIVDEMCY